MLGYNCRSVRKLNAVCLKTKDSHIGVWLKTTARCRPLTHVARLGTQVCTCVGLPVMIERRGYWLDLHQRGAGNDQGTWLYLHPSTGANATLSWVLVTQDGTPTPISRAKCVPHRPPHPRARESLPGGGLIESFRHVTF